VQPQDWRFGVARSIGLRAGRVPRKSIDLRLHNIQMSDFAENEPAWAPGVGEARDK
jgi:hypothetical protein